MHILGQLPLLSHFLASSHSAATHFCKRDPLSAEWPSVPQWQALNASVAGNLDVPTAPGAVCHPNQPTFKNASCGTVAFNFSSTDWVAQNPWVADYNDNTCLPSAGAPCSAAGYPAYVIKARNALDVAAGLRFAKENQVRLIVKGTGHDFPGRSSGPGSLSIWTHNIRGLQVDMYHPKAVQYGGVGAMRIAAGMRMAEIYREAARYNLTVVGGADLDVGIGGWVIGGGHSPISSEYGLGVDQVLEMDVVTADGQILTINETCHEDLFWAMRGGGGSTFAVLLSVTVKVYPSIPVTNYAFTYNTTSDSDTFWAEVAHFHADLPRISNSGGMGYYFVVPFDNSTGFDQGFVAGQWLFPGKPIHQAQAIVTPFEQMLNNSPSWAGDQITVQSFARYSEDFTTEWLKSPPQAGGIQGRLGSYLFDEEALTSNVSDSAIQLKRASPSPWMLLGHLVGGLGVHNVTVPGGSSAVLPAWRKAYSHVVLPRIWASSDAAQKIAVTRSLRSDQVPALKSLARTSGAYINEADPTNPDWKKDYFGTNYNRLLEIKHKWDPEGVFWCRPCVGHDEWELQDGPAEEDPDNWGVSQVGANICKKRSSR